MSKLSDERAWLANPGLRPVPSRAKTPHVFGGAVMKMPICRCGHEMRAWLTLDPRKVRALAKLLPGWRRLPLLGCVDCMEWMGRHDYEIDADFTEVRLVHVAMKKGEYDDPLDEAEPPPRRQFVRLEPRRAVAKLTEDDLDAYFEDEEPSIGGAPPWYQKAVAVKCRACGRPMTYVAAMGTTTRFARPVMINNDSGRQYHFACPRCRTLSVIAQWS